MITIRKKLLNPGNFLLPLLDVLLLLLMVQYSVTLKAGELHSKASPTNQHKVISDGQKQ